MLDKKGVYEEKVKPLVEELRRTCYSEGIPMFCSCATKDDGEKTVYDCEMVSSTALNTALSEDKLIHFVHVLRGYTPMAPQDMDEIEY